MGFSNVRKYFFSFENLILLGALFGILSAGILNHNIKKPLIQLSKQDSALNLNENIYRFMNIGNKRLITDLLWIQTLIESDLEHYKQRDLNSWMFLRFKSISLLDPKFYENYLYGGQFLGVVKDDLEGAKFIYDKGLSLYPDDYFLNYHAGFLNYYEIGNFEVGLKYLLKIKDQPKTPFFLNSIINKLQFETGMDLKEVYKIVLYNYQTANDIVLKNKLEKDLYAIKAEIDLTCLNKQEGNCESKDYYGQNYIQRGSTYHTARKFLLYRINKRGRTSSPQPFIEIDSI